MPDVLQMGCESVTNAPILGCAKSLGCNIVSLCTALCAHVTQSVHPLCWWVTARGGVVVPSRARRDGDGGHAQCGAVWCTQPGVAPRHAQLHALGRFVRTRSGQWRRHLPRDQRHEHIARHGHRLHLPRSTGGVSWRHREHGIAGTADCQRRALGCCTRAHGGMLWHAWLCDRA